MTARILDGKALAETIKAELKDRVSALAEHGVVPGLGTVLVGDDPGSRSYVREAPGLRAGRHRLDPGGTAASTSQEQLASVIAGLNADPACTGYIVQLPLPGNLDDNAALALVDPDKDADGLHPVNLGKLVLGVPGPLPCTPRGIVELLRRNGIGLNGAEVCVIGRGTTVGRPLGLLLTRKSENATVTLCHTGTVDLSATLSGRHRGCGGGRPGSSPQR